MASKTIKRALFETLEDLSRRDFERFCFSLLDRREGPRVRRSSLEGRSRVEVVEVLVSTFGAGAVQVAVEILRDIGCHQDAETLDARPSAGAGFLFARADDRHFLDEHRSKLIQRVNNIRSILEDLLEKNILHLEEYEEIRALPTPLDKMRLLMNSCLRKGSAVKDIFYSILEKHEPYLIHDLKEKDRNRQFLDEHRPKLIQRVSNILPILDNLLVRQVINNEEYEVIRAQPTSHVKMRQLIDSCRRKGSVAQDILFSILEEHEPYLIHDLKVEGRRKYKNVIDTLETMAVKRLLFETLNDLSLEELHKFKSLFEEEKGFPVKPRRRLKVYVHDLMDLMVEMLIPECVEVTKNVLEKMNRSDLVQKWLNKIPETKEKQQPPPMQRVDTMASVKELHLETLNALGDEELKTFKEFLEFDVAQKFLPDISSMLRLTVDRADIVDLMVQTYSQQSVELTREVVEKMKRTDLLQRLSKFSSGLKGPSENLELEVKTMASVIELLLETLAALNDEELKKFKLVLRDHIHSNRRFLDIPLLLLETTGSQDTVFSMVLTRGQQAVEKTNELLKNMERTDLVQRLTDSSMEPKKKHSDEHRAALIHRVATMAAVKQLLLETLNDLSQDELEKFKAVLELNVSQKDLPDIFGMLRQTSDRADTVDLMVQTYGQLSVDLSREILMNINRNDLTQRLSGLKEKHSVDEHRPACWETAEVMSAVKHIILETLKDLSNEELKEFKWLLQLTYFKKGLPHISWRRLDWADSAGALVDLMVENQQLMEVTKEVFMDMNRPDLVERLSETSSELKEKHPSEPLQKEVTTASIMETLLETLEDLSYGELEQFKWLLQHTERGKDLSKVSTYQMETAGRREITEMMVETYGQQSVEVTREVLMKMNRRDLVQRFSEISLGSEEPSGSLELEGCSSTMQVSSVWTKLDPEVNRTDEAPTYSLQSEAGNFECRISGLRWICKDKVSFRYQFRSLKDHMKRIESIKYMPAGPLMDITVSAGKIDIVYLPHWIYVDDPTLLDKFAVLHIDDCGVTVDKVSEVTSSHVKLCEPAFSGIMSLLQWLGILAVEIYCKVLIYCKTDTESLTLHVYLIPPDPALIEEIDQMESSEEYKRIRKPHPKIPLKMNGLLIVKAQLDEKEIAAEDLRLRHDIIDTDFAEVYIENPSDRNVELKLTQEKREQLVWSCLIRKGEYQSSGHTQEEHPVDELRPALLQEAKAKEMLLKILKNLKDEQFNSFIWHLVNLGDIPEGELDNKKSGEVVNKIWQTYTQRSVEVTKTVLGNIPRNDLVELLDDQLEHLM